MQEQEKNKKDFSISVALSEGWRLFMSQLGNILLLEVIGLTIIVPLVLFSAELIKPIPHVGFWLDSILQLLLQSFASIAAIHVGLKIADSKEVNVYDLFNRLDLFFKYFAALICYQVAVLLGLICFIIPGIICMIRFGLFGFFIVDKGAGPIEALKMSWETIRGCSWRFFLFQMVNVLLNVLGILCLVVGVLFSIPTTVLASVLIYRTLFSQTYGIELSPK